MNKQPLNDYPRPQFYRDSYKSLNGFWDYKISKSPEIPEDFDGQILVPYSPETSLSGVNHILQPDEYLFYRLKFSLYDFQIKDKVFLHFLAVDQIADVYLNGNYLGKHVGGFLPFSFEIKKYIKDENELIVRVQDFTDTSYLNRLNIIFRNAFYKNREVNSALWSVPNSSMI